VELRIRDDAFCLTSVNDDSEQEVLVNDDRTMVSSTVGPLNCVRMSGERVRYWPIGITVWGEDPILGWTDRWS